MNLGTVALKRIIANRKIRQKVAAAESGVPESKLSRILSDQVAPNLEEAVMLQKWAGIDPALWTQKVPDAEPPSKTGTEQ
jgi:transcriptional regulator with XRE-family HTH domain